VSVEEGGRTTEGFSHSRKVSGVKPDVFKYFGFGVYVKLGLPGVVWVFNEALPLVEERLLCFDKVGQVRSHHRYHIGHSEFFNQFPQEQTVIFLRLRAHQQYLSPRIIAFSILLRPQVKLLKDKPVRNVEASLSLNFFFPLDFLLDVFIEVKFDCIRLFLRFDVL
jgi:hypothetical protein